MPRDRYTKQSLGALHGQIKETRALLVGAGGIGCELLKNLVLTGFGEVHIVDLDTIDLSNLNRQFLFRQEHIKKSKALTAKETASRFNPQIKIEAHHANIKDSQFNIEWFQGFNIIFNALDNLDARRHVNRMCLAADVPLIESGTTGFNGQVQVIKKVGKTECYDCNTKEVPKSFPVCTIRSTPSQPIHCIVWAKSYLFTELFGVSEDDTPDLDNLETSENAQEIENLRRESQALKRLRGSIGSPEFPRKVFEKVFKDDVERLRSIEDMWKTRKPPTALDFDSIAGDNREVDNLSIPRHDQVAWTVEENFEVFSDSLRRLSDRVEKAGASLNENSAVPILTFDKDDEDSLDFIVATANLRSIVFGIETKSKFDIKPAEDTTEMAGNIVPAIATTNAMTAGLCVLQAFKVLRDTLGKARMVFLERSAARVINTDTLKPPNPYCGICGVAQSILVVDTHRATLKDLVDDVLKIQLGYGEEFSINNETGTLYDPELDENLSKKFTDLGLKADTFLTIVDEDEENPRVNLSLSISERQIPESSKPIIIPGKLGIARKPRCIKRTVFEQQDPDTAPLKRKRSNENGDNGSNQIKRGKVETFGSQNPDVVIVEDADDGAIIVDDD